MQEATKKKNCRTFKLPAKQLTCSSSAAPRSIADTIESFGRMLTAEDLSELLACSPKTIYSRAKASTMPVTRFGGSIRFDPIATAAWLRSQAA